MADEFTGSRAAIRRAALNADGTFLIRQAPNSLAWVMGRMRELVLADVAKLPAVGQIRFALLLAKRLDRNSIPRELEKVLAGAITYRSDESSVGATAAVEFLRGPIKTVNDRAGDCEDIAMLGAALLILLDFQPFFRFYQTQAIEGSEFVHVATGVLLDDGRQVILDPARLQTGATPQTPWFIDVPVE